MLKKAAFLSFVLILMIGILLIWQWNSYSGQSNGGRERNGEIVREIDISVETDRLQITQKISGLTPEREYKLEFPFFAENITYPTGSQIGRDGEKKEATFIVAKDEPLSFSFEIPFAKGNEPLLFQEWTGKISGISFTKNTIELADHEKGKGTWVAGLPLMTKKELEHIDYYYFNGRGDSPALYWHPSSLMAKMTEDDKMLIFYEGKEPNFLIFSSLEELKHFPFNTLVLTARTEEKGAGGILFLNRAETDGGSLEGKLVYHYFLSKFSGSDGEKDWAADLLTSLFLARDPQTEKAAAAVSEFEKNFTNEELAEFLETAISKNNDLTKERLDESLGAIKGVKTEFFTLNDRVSSKFIPLYFYDDRNLLIDGVEMKEVEVVYLDGVRFYPVRETFQALGYEVNILENGKKVLLSRDSSNYRFYTDQNIFIFNEEDYGLLERPMRKIHNKIYIKEKWLKTIFHCVIKEQENSLEVIPIEKIFP